MTNTSALTSMIEQETGDFWRTYRARTPHHSSFLQLFSKLFDFRLFIGYIGDKSSINIQEVS